MNKNIFHILIVDDDDRIRELVRQYLEKSNFLVTTAKDALDAKKMGRRNYEKAYQLAGDLAVNKGKDFHDDNKFEKTAEEWGKSEYRKWKNKF